MFKVLSLDSMLTLLARQAAGVSAEASASAVMDALREKKNNFRG